MWRLTRSAAASLRRSRRFSATVAAPAATIPGPCMVPKRGADILQDPWFNKDTAFPLTERDRLGLRGLLPPRIISFEQQHARFMESYRSLEKNTRGQPEVIVYLAKWRILNRLHDRNETLFYRVLIDNIEDFAPIVYTPTVGLVCQNYSGLFRRPRGMYFSAKDKGEMMSMIYNWPAPQVDMIVITDGSRILGLGDLGVQGIGIPIGKLDVYVAAAGINPQRVLPVMLDVGTNNQRLLEDRLYLGLRQPRLEGEEYLSTVDEFMEAVRTRWPKAVVQFEDFQMKWAFETLQRYRTRFCMFNDDVQGTAGVALAGLLGAVRAQGRPLTDFVKQKIVVVGAGSAGLGVLNMAVRTVSRMAGANGLPNKHHFYLIDKDGLITKERKNLDPAAAPFARDPDETEGLKEGASLVEVVRKVKPDVLLGLSGVGGVFTEEVLRAMRESDCPRPAIFAMSNPTSNAECTPADAFKYAGEHIVFASGSPFQNVVLENGHVGHVNQANNMYLFPGIGLGALVSGARYITDEMLHAAAESLASYMTDEEIRSGVLYPSISSIREITAEVAAAVLREATAAGLAEGYGDVGPKELSSMSKAESVEYVKRNMWFPIYSPLVHEK
uniref:Malic enzyme n=1 Tax=Opuntia streptacantha TaxID=393608 RepID=A0A7C8ZII5_OPUST